MRLQMEFMTPLRRQWLTVSLLVVGLAGSAHALWQRAHLIGAIAAEQAAIAQQEQEWSQQRRATDPLEEDPQRRVAVETVSAALQRPWERMLDALRATVGPDFELTRIQPEEESGRLLVSGKASDAQAFLGTVTRLRESGEWRQVEPLSQERTAADGRVAFRLQLEWRP